MVKVSLQKSFFLFIEHLLIQLSVVSATVIRLQRFYIRDYHLSKIFLVAGICQICLYYNDFYDFKVVNNIKEVLIRLIQSLGISSIVLAGIYYVFPLLYIGRGIFFITILIIVILICSWRVLYWKVSNSTGLRENILIVGSGKMAETVAREVMAHTYFGFNIVGFVDNDEKMKGVSIVNPKVLGTYNELLDIVNEKSVSRIIIAMSDRRGTIPLSGLMDCRFRGITVEEATSFYERITGKIMIENLKPSWLIFADGFKKLTFSNRLKRITGVMFSSIGIVFLSPIIVLTAIVIKLDSKGPVFYRQKRMGANEKIFTLLKFRSMNVDAETESGSVWARDEDERVTKAGRFIRMTRIDETPQLFNVLKGDMNFVGPRPERPFFVEQLKKEIPYYSQRLSVKPGITGWAQTKYKYGNSVKDALEKLQYDLYYIKNCSLFLDISIIFETIKVVLMGKGAK